MEIPDNLDEAFKDLKKKEYWPFAEGLSAYRDALLDKGFTRREAMRLIEHYAKFIYDLAFEEVLHKKAEEGFDDDMGDLPEDDDEGEN